MDTKLTDNQIKLLEHNINIEKEINNFCTEYENNKRKNMLLSQQRNNKVRLRLVKR